MTCGVCFRTIPPPPPLRADYDSRDAWIHERAAWEQERDLSNTLECACERCETCQGVFNDALGLAPKQVCRCKPERSPA